jgi:hypothetical protein
MLWAAHSILHSEFRFQATTLSGHMSLGSAMDKAGILGS